MSSKSYALLLRNPLWKAKREEILLRDNHICSTIGCKATTYLQVHHLKYIKGRLPWDYTNDYFILLCRSCHKKEHYKLKAASRLKRKIAREMAKLKKLKKENL